jgi:hypothetical protein
MNFFSCPGPQCLGVFILQKAKPESTECCIEEQAFLSSSDLAPPSSPPPSPPCQQSVSISQSLCVSPVELTDGRGERGWRRSQIIWQWESLASLNHSIPSGLNQKVIIALVQKGICCLLFLKIQFETMVWYTLQMKGWWESNINVWCRFMYSQKWNCATLLFPKPNYYVLNPNFHIHVVIDLFIPTIGLPILLQPNRQTDPGNT